MNLTDFLRSMNMKYLWEPLDDISREHIIEDTKLMYSGVAAVKVEFENYGVKLVLEFKTPEELTWFVLKWA